MVYNNDTINFRMTKNKNSDVKIVDSKSQILNIAQNAEGVNSSELVQTLGLSRQMIARHLSALVEAGKLRKEGSTRGAKYYKAKGASNQKLSKIIFTKKLKGLEEDVVYSELFLRANLSKFCSEKSLAIFKYAFTEMLNNAIDHSNSEKVDILFEVQNKNLSFEIRDHGIGAYERVRSFFKLENHFQAVEHLLKGKQTTDSIKHSGQGIFFTSRSADVFTLKSAKVELTVDNHKDDYFLKDVSKLKGTLVRFQISRQTRKDLRNIFNEYSNNDFEFDRNSVRIKLSSEKNLVSRSEAKRLLVGLELYSRIEFDFKKVTSIGQGFADEIFRVFQKAHPQIMLTYTHASSAIAFMIERSRSNR